MVTSSAVVGSSAISSRGPQASAIAIITRCRMPPESSCGYCAHAPLGLGDADLAQHLDGVRHRVGAATGRGAGPALSAICRPTVSTGLSEVIGSWKIIEIALPRTVAHLLVGQREQIAALEQHAPGDDAAGGEATGAGSRASVTLLPQPDSPTTASVSPGDTTNDTPSTARTMPSRVKKCVLRPSIESSGCTAAPWRSASAAIASHPPREPRIERVAHAVAEQVHREHGQRQEEAREAAAGSRRSGTGCAPRP